MENQIRQKSWNSTKLKVREIPVRNKVKIREGKIC